MHHGHGAWIVRAELGFDFLNFRLQFIVRQRRFAKEFAFALDGFTERLVVSLDLIEAVQVDIDRLVMRSSRRCNQSDHGEFFVMDMIPGGAAMTQLELCAQRPAIFNGNARPDIGVEGLVKCRAFDPPFDSCGA